MIWKNLKNYICRLKTVAFSSQLLKVANITEMIFYLLNRWGIIFEKLCRSKLFFKTHETESYAHCQNS